MTAIEKLCRLSEEELASQDPGDLNIACSTGLPGGKPADPFACRKKLDEMAEVTRRETNRLHYLFLRRPWEYHRSLSVFRANVLVTVLQRDFGLEYGKDLIELEDHLFFRNPENLFIHGALQGRGTCASLAPTYLAVGWRLGYPIKLVTCCQHVFARWDGDGDRFNIECTSHGFVSHPDDYYRTWPKPLTEKQVNNYQALRSFTPRQTLAHFMKERGICWVEHRRFKDAVSAFVWACDLSPDCWAYSHALVHAMNAWDRELRGLMMPGFPSMTLHFPQRWFDTIPRDLELGIVHMIVKENLLNEPQYKSRWWEPLRANPAVRPKDLPAHITVEYGKVVPGPQVPRVTLRSV